MRRPSLLIIALLLVASGCPWRSYDEILRVHLDVLSGLADKAAGNAAAGQRATSNDVVELTYPLQRARQFVTQYAGNAERPSYRLFVVALDRYEALLDAIDAARGDPVRWRAAQADIAARYDAWRAAASDVRSALAHDRSSVTRDS